MSEPPRGPDPGAVEALLAAAEALRPDARADFLHRECGDDADLRAEVLSLLEQVHAASSFFERLRQAMSNPLPDVGSQGAGAPLPAGSMIGRYRILEPLGGGGMGAVYRAHDPALRRDVALKVLAPWLAASPTAHARFVQEGRAAASLDHPNIATIHDVGWHDGHPFLAMAILEGETLEQRLARGALEPAEAGRIAEDIARGLAAAHRKGMIHRDIKPGNVMLCLDGSVKILDFGLARMADSGLTGPGPLPGTLAYMAPEHVRGDPIDARADLWSLGVVLYEMLTGRRPFRGGSDRALGLAIEHDPPAPISLSGPHPVGHEAAGTVPAGVSRIVERLLEKDPERRYPSAEALLLDLGATDRASAAAEFAAGAGRPGAARFPMPGSRAIRPRAIRPRSVGMVGAVVAALGLALWWPWGGAGRGPDPSVVAILPFETDDPTLAGLGEDMVDLLGRRLHFGEALRPVEASRVLAAWGEVARGAPGDPEVARTVAAGLGAGRMVQGRIVSAGDGIRLSARIEDLISGETAVADVDPAPTDSLSTLVDRFASRLLAIAQADTARLASISTGSLEAVRAYLHGEEAFREGRFDVAALRFREALEQDSTFALAALMAAQSTGRAQPIQLDGNYLALAWRHRDRLGPRERTYLAAGAESMSDYAGPAASLADAQRLVAIRPDDPEAWERLAARLPQALVRSGAPDTTAFGAAAAALRRALELDRGRGSAVSDLVLVYSNLGDSARALGLVRHQLEGRPGGLPEEQARCVLRGVAGDEFSSENLEGLGERALARCLSDLHWFWPEAHAARDTLGAWFDRRIGSPAVMADAAPILYAVALDRGRPGDARRNFELWGRLALPSHTWTEGVTMAVRDALHTVGDRGLATRKAEEARSRLRSEDPGLEPEERARVLCALGQWEADRERYGQVEGRIAELRALADARATGWQVAAEHCTMLLETWVAWDTRQPDVDDWIAALQTMQRDGSRDGRLIREGAFLLARIHLSRGDPVAALDAVNRSRVTTPMLVYNERFLRERGRAAALAGDTALALRAYRHWLAMHSDPEPEQAEAVDLIRRELLALGGTVQ